MSATDLDRRFIHIPPTPERVRLHEQVRAACRDLAGVFDQAVPEGREKALALTHLETAMFWANAALARHSAPTP
ncbi:MULTISPECIES: hypothetical protein [unclassified Nocardia]|uniref:Acb2/Tad1 domain-containing protein n=1 Tax=unclassified Nocardia TaxID=2637762 RepID=UPI00278C3182|nr:MULTISPECIES: hypothetical protein [unclassified Nocardia]